MTVETVPPKRSSETPPEIDKSVEEMIADLKAIQSQENGKNMAFLAAGNWLRNLHIEAMESGDHTYRFKAWDFCRQAEETLDLLNESHSTHPKELPEQQQILASMAYYHYKYKNNDKYLNEYKDWVVKHRSHTKNDMHRRALKEITSPDYPDNLAEYEDLWEK